MHKGGRTERRKTLQGENVINKSEKMKRNKGCSTLGSGGSKKKKKKGSVSKVVLHESIKKLGYLHQEIEAIPNAQPSIERINALKRLSTSRRYFWASISHACQDIPYISFLNFRETDSFMCPYLCWWPVDLYLLYQQVHKRGGVDAMDQTPCGSTHPEAFTESGEKVRWPLAWEEVYLRMTSFLPREHVEKVPWRRTKLRELYRKTVGLILAKTPTHVLENAIFVCDKNEDLNVLFPADYIRCVCGHHHEDPPRGDSDDCSGCRLLSNNGRGGGREKAKPQENVLQCSTCGMWQHIACAEAYGLLKDLDNESNTDSSRPDPNILPDTYSCELCLGLASSTVTKFFTPRMKLKQACLTQRTPDLLKYELPNTWSCVYKFRLVDNFSKGDFYVQRGFEQVIAGINQSNIRSKPALESFAAPPPAPPGKLQDIEGIKQNKYIAGYMIKRQATKATKKKKNRLGKRKISGKTRGNASAKLEMQLGRAFIGGPREHKWVDFRKAHHCGTHLTRRGGGT